MIDLQVEGMTCGGCVKSVEKAVLRADPQAAVKIDLQSGKVSIQSAVSPSLFSAAIEAAGYDVVGAPQA